MNIDEYAGKYFALYESFAETVQFIVKKALLVAETVPHPQSIQYRAKSIESLRNRLADDGKLESQTLEQDRRDLAGVRIILYTNNDVENFLNSRLIPENFEIDEGATKIHHPVPENENARYRGIHYTVRLREDRICLPEYARFSGLRCEVQVQTILNHAWSETSHDIVYKNKLSDGYGKRAMEGITRRFERIMDEYLIPAGYEIQKAQQEYERLLRGKQLFDNDVVTLLDNAQNNNQRYEVLSSLQNHAIPYYDDLPAAYDRLKAPLLRAVLTSRETEQVQVETAFGSMEGFNTEAITKLVVEIIEELRYADAVTTLQLLIDIYRDEPNERVRERIVNVSKHLAGYNIDVYQQVGLVLQMALVDRLNGMDAAEVDRIRPIALAVWSEALQLTINGHTWKGDSVIFRSGAVPASDQLMEVRDKAIVALFAAYDRSTDDSQRLRVLSALDNATRVPSQVASPDELLTATLRDATRIIEFMTERAPQTSYELLRHLEHQYLYDYYRVSGLADSERGKAVHQAEAAALVRVVFRFRDAVNADKLFVRYKVLVGHESVLSAHWTDRNLDYKESDAYRRQEVDRYVSAIDTESEKDWFELATRCAQARSSDLAMFAVFGDFIVLLSKRKPEVAERFLAKACDDLHGFLAAFLIGLAASSRQDIYERVLSDELDSARNLAAVVHHLRYSEARLPLVARRLLDRAMQTDNAVAVAKLLSFAMEAYGTEKLDDADAVTHDALVYLTERKDVSWVSDVWFAAGLDATFYQKASPERLGQILKNLAYLPKVDRRVERILRPLAERYPEAMWDYFGDRLARAELVADENEDKFEAVPYRLHDLQKALSKDAKLAVAKGMAWFTRDATLFQYRGGRLLGAVFPRDTDAFMAVLAELVKEGGETEADFALAILRNYHGEAFTHVVLTEIVSRFSEDDRRRDGIRSCIESTGVIHGELGIANAWRARKESLSKWLEDPRQEVSAFAKREMTNLDLMIAAEERRAEEVARMRKMDYENTDDEDEGKPPPGRDVEH
ncbi:RelA/SpoT domain-containing protein [Bordetella genomosp. 11]|uniref:RelA/SpoT domain-containing protein n=1 Tax=Bordetella genomosp. 11 TaxID=1416808 RepID=A0A261UJQ2_9BORD|nr:RelA/SpoT domain-containing protein [Bordetella genomosp. 11]OZI62108.1 hypothetical protein CAL28_23060 [Bordetella genomosp. 11]